MTDCGVVGFVLVVGVDFVGDGCGSDWDSCGVVVVVDDVSMVKMMMMVPEEVVAAAENPILDVGCDCCFFFDYSFVSLLLSSSRDRLPPKLGAAVTVTPSIWILLLLLLLAASRESSSSVCA